MNLQNVQALVEQVAQAVMQLRVTLENHELPGLEAAIVNSQMALKGLEAHPGGVEGLRQLITTFPADAQKQLNDRLEEARSNHQLNWPCSATLLCRHLLRSLLRAPLTPARAVCPSWAAGSCWASSDSSAGLKRPAAREWRSSPVYATG